MSKKSIVQKNTISVFVIPIIIVLTLAGLAFSYIIRSMENTMIEVKNEMLFSDTIKDIYDLYSDIGLLELKLLSEDIEIPNAKQYIEKKNITLKSIKSKTDFLKKNIAEHTKRNEVLSLIKLVTEDSKTFEEYFSTAEIYHSTKDITTFDIMKNIAMKRDRERIDIRLLDIKKLIKEFKQTENQNSIINSTKLVAYFGIITALFLFVVLIFVISLKVILNANKKENKEIVLKIFENNRIIVSDEIKEAGNEFEIINNIIIKYKEGVAETLRVLKNNIGNVKNTNKEALHSIVNIINSAEKNEEEIESNDKLFQNAENEYVYEAKDRQIISELLETIEKTTSIGKNKIEVGKNNIEKLKTITSESRETISAVGECFKYIEDAVTEIEELAIYTNQIYITSDIESGKQNSGISAIEIQAKKLSEKIGMELKIFKGKLREMKDKERNSYDKMGDSILLMDTIIEEWKEIEKSNCDAIDAAEIFIKESINVDNIIQEKEKRYSEIYKKKVEVFHRNKRIIEELEKHYEQVKVCLDEIGHIEEGIVINKD